MIKIVNGYEGLRIRQLQDFKMMLSDEYLFNQRILQTRFIVEQFMKPNDKDLTRDQRLRLLNITLGLPAMIAEKLSDYVGQPNCPYQIDVPSQVFSLSWAGYSVMRVSLVEGKLVVEKSDADGYVKNDDGSEQLLTAIDGVDENGKVKVYILSQTYRPGTIENRLFELKTTATPDTEAIWGDPLPLNAIPATNGMNEIEKTGLKINPISVANNSFIENNRYGMSEIKRIRSLLNSIEIQIVNVQDQLLKHLNAIMAVPGSKLAVNPDTGLVDMRNLEIIAMEVGDTPPQYVVNQNPMIDKSFALIENLLRQICAVLSIPAEFINLKSEGGVESGVSKTIRVSSFLKKVSRVRDTMQVAIDKVHLIAEGWRVAVPENEYRILWPSVFPVDKKEEIDELASASSAGLISKVRAIMRYQDLTEEEAMAELEAINKENATLHDEALAV